MNDSTALNSVIAEMDAAGQAHSHSCDVERSAYAHLVEAKKAWRLAVQLAEAETANVQRVCAKAQKMLDANTAARA